MLKTFGRKDVYKRQNETSTFASKESTDEYVDTAIARNIQHSLRCYQYEGHFRHLRDLYEKGELTSAINRVVEDINHRFTLEVLSQDWKSHDLGISASNLRRDRKNPTDILDRIDLALVTDSLRKLLEIRNRAEPVSYTHLDVYKRQGLVLVTLLRMKILRSLKKRLIISKIISERRKSCELD